MKTDGRDRFANRTWPNMRVKGGLNSLRKLTRETINANLVLRSAVKDYTTTGETDIRHIITLIVNFINLTVISRKNIGVEDDSLQLPESCHDHASSISNIDRFQKRTHFDYTS